MFNNKKGEIATVIALAVFLLIGVSSLLSSAILKKPKTTQTKAQYCARENESIEGTDIKCCAGLIPDDLSTCRTVAGLTATPTPPPFNQLTNVTPMTYSGADDRICSCINGNPSNISVCGDANPCGAKGGSCDSYGAWKDQCTGSAENCPTDAGITYTYWCDGSDWRFQYPNCVTWCKPAYLSQAPAKPAGICDGKAPGTVVSSDNPPSNVSKGSDVGVSDFTYVSCDGNQGVYVEIRPFCDQFGQVQWGPARRSSKLCGGATKEQPQSYTVPKAWQTPPPTPRLKLTPIVFKNTTISSSQKKDGTENAICGPELGCNEGLVCDKSSGAYGYGFCKKSTTTSPTEPAPSTPSQTNQCPFSEGAQCVGFSCGSGYQSIDRKCGWPWEVCCVKSQVANKYPVRTAQPSDKTIEVEMPPGGIEQFGFQEERKLYKICDYYGYRTLFNNAPIVENCQSPKVTQKENVLTITYTVNKNQAQLLCRVDSIGGVPSSCVKLDQLAPKQKSP